MVKRKAFSLIELLIVIALIGILTAVATVSYSTIQKRSRDSRRISDLKAIQHGLEQYFSDNTSTYPSPCTAVGTTYLPTGLPVDPKTGLAYVQECNIGSYCVCASLEVDRGNATTDCTGTTGTFYCIYQMQ